ncbi:hypothetical protein V6R21_05775 [Limibacter armeniacum]|uniref:hypothetical protein n=1 Tax=Limibacter armeniacum TaxID=466084 RepID=UPI002FE51660
MRIIFIIITLICISSCGSKVSGDKITYLSNENYLYLDEDYNPVNLNSQIIDSIARGAKVFNNPLKTKQEIVSLLIYDKNNYAVGPSNLELYRLNVGWPIIGQYFMEDSATVKNWGKELNLKYPSDLLSYFNDSTINSVFKKEKELKLREKCYLLSKDSTVFNLGIEELTYFSFKLGRSHNHTH